MSITPNTRVTLTIGSVLALIAVGWRAGTEAAAIRTEMAELRRDVRNLSGATWTAADMERWSYRLDVANRERGLVVPDVRSVKADRGQ